MKITDVKVWLVRGIKYNWTLLKIYTDEGYTGVGEATNWPGSPIVFEAAEHAGQRIIGLDPMKTDFIWTKLYRDLNWIGPYGASLCAISGIDMALLDLKAKVLGVPCYELLGGAYRKDILLYANYWFTGGGHNEADYAAQARRVMDAGFTGLKVVRPLRPHELFLWRRPCLQPDPDGGTAGPGVQRLQSRARGCRPGMRHHDRDTRHAELPGCRQDGGTLGKARYHLV